MQFPPCDCFRSMILSRRVNDDDHRDGFTKWPFMTTHTWGEYPQGTWLLEVNFDIISEEESFLTLFPLMSFACRPYPVGENLFTGNSQNNGVVREDERRPQGDLFYSDLYAFFTTLFMTSTNRLINR